MFDITIHLIVGIYVCMCTPDNFQGSCCSFIPSVWLLKFLPPSGQKEAQSDELTPACFIFPHRTFFQRITKTAHRGCESEYFITGLIHMIRKGHVWLMTSNSGKYSVILKQVEVICSVFDSDDSAFNYSVKSICYGPDVSARVVKIYLIRQWNW